MTFKISRTTQWRFDKNNPPCKGAVAGVEEYQFCERVFDENGKRIWQSAPRTRDVWTIEINTLEDLMALKKEVNDDEHNYGLIIFDADDENTLPEIEIYDGYRE